jgi:formate dehydrogenase subunit delta
MDVNNLIEMANQIGDFFDSMPDREEALAGIADHIRKFWAPRMRVPLLEALDDPTLTATIKPIVVEALEKHRMALMPVVVG